MFLQLTRKVLGRIIRVYQRSLKMGLCRISYPFVFWRYRYPESYRQYITTPAAIAATVDSRKNGISGYCRIYNEEPILRQSIELCLPCYDEMILVYDSSTGDDSPRICRELQGKYPDKIKMFFYEPEVYKPRSKNYLTLPPTHPNSFINYYNFALSKTTRKVVGKVDADMFVIRKQFDKVIDMVRNTSVLNKLPVTYCAINLSRHPDTGEYMVHSKHPLVAWRDHCLHLMKRSPRYYIRRYEYEQPDNRFIPHKSGFEETWVTHFHLQRLVPNRMHNYRNLTPQAYEEWKQQKSADRLNNLIPWDQFIEEHRRDFLQKFNTDLPELPHPNDFFRPLFD